MAQEQFIKTFPKGLDLKLSENFHLREFECKCTHEDCTETLVSMAHVARLEHLRRRLDKPIKINSAYRCKAHNKAVGGTPNSQHRLGTATDLALKFVDAILFTSIFPGVIIYDTFVHTDSRTGTPLLLYKLGDK